MKIEYTREDVVKGLKNPFYHELCRDVTVGVRHDDYKLFEKIAESYNVAPETIMQMYLRNQADLLREDYPNE